MAERPALPIWWSGFVAIVVGYVVAGLLFGMVSVLAADADASTATLIGTYVQDGALFVSALLLGRLGGGAGGLRALGWCRIGSPAAAVWKAALVVAAFYGFSAVFAEVVDLRDASDGTVDALGLRTDGARLAFGIILLTLVAPIVEETVFRGLLFGALWRWRGWAFGAVVSGVVFGGIHVGGAPAAALPVLAMLGFGLAALYRWTGSLLPSIGVHALNNAVTLASILEWDLRYRVMLVVVAPAVAVGLAWLGSSGAATPVRADRRSRP